MNVRNWKMMALALGLLFTTQACAIWVGDDDDYYHHGYWRGGYGYREWRHSSLQQPDQTLSHDFLAKNMLNGQEELR